MGHALKASRVQIRVNGEVIATPRIVSSIRDVEEALASQEKSMLVLSEEQPVLCSVVARVGSYSCAIGGKDLCGALSPVLQAIDQIHRDAAKAGKIDVNRNWRTTLYACENDHEAVESLSTALAGRIDVVPVLVDRVCTAREMHADGSVDVSAEPYSGDLVLTPPVDLDMPRPPLPFAGQHVRQPQTSEGAAFLHRKKILSVNGTHTTIAFLTLIAGEAPNHTGLPSRSHELLSYAVDDAIQGRSACADVVGRAVWVWAVARQLMLLYEFDDTVVRHTLGVPASRMGDDALIEALLAGAKTAVARLSRGGDQTSRVLGGGVENRWRTRLANVQEFLSGIVRLDPLSRKLLGAAGVTETELRVSVSKLVRDSKRFIVVAKPRSPSPHKMLTALPMRPSPTPAKARSSSRKRPLWITPSRSKSPPKATEARQLPSIPTFPGLG